MSEVVSIGRQSAAKNSIGVPVNMLDMVAVAVESLNDHEKEIDTPEGKLTLTTHYRQETVSDGTQDLGRATIKGKVVGIPSKLSKYRVDGHPQSPHNHKGFQENDIELNLAIGDKVYFHYTETGQHRRFLGKTAMGDDVLAMKLSHIICRAPQPAREGGVLGIDTVGSWLLVEPETKENMAGSLHLPHKEMNRAQVGRIAAAGPPLKFEFGNMRDLKVGDRVVFDKNCHFENMIEGKSYYCMYRGNIWGILPENAIVNPIK